MNFDKKMLSLYAVTDRRWLKDKTLAEFCDMVIPHGITCLQLREKNLDHESLVLLGKEIKKICDKHNIPLIINDDPFVAKEINADGVHIGQDDMPIYKAREILGKDKIIGTSAHNVYEARKAQEDGADYIGVGAVFGSSTKENVCKMTPKLLKEIKDSVDIGVVAIGGINLDNIELLRDTGVDGIAVVSAIFGSNNPCRDTERLKRSLG